jgi:hypothetical protein
MVLNRRVIIFALPAVVYLLSGCVVAPSSKTSASFIDQAQKIRTVVLIPSEIKVYQIDAGGVREEIQAWSAQAKENVISAVQNELRSRINAVVRIADEDSMMDERPRLQPVHRGGNNDLAPHLPQPQLSHASFLRRNLRTSTIHLAEKSASWQKKPRRCSFLRPRIMF